MNQTEKKKKAILETTFQLLNEKEIKDITVDEIAQKAVVSKVTLFKYFQNKSALMSLVLRKALENMASQIEEIIQSPLDFQATYAAITKLKLQHLERYSAVFSENLITQYRLDPNFIDPETLLAQERVYHQLFAKGQAEGQIAANYTVEDFEFILHIFSEGMKNSSADVLFQKVDLITRFFINGWK